MTCNTYLNQIEYKERKESEKLKMKKVKLGKTGLDVSAIALGCMRFGGLEETQAKEFVETALEHGINYIDHADIYGGGYCEQLFGKVADLKGDSRERFFIQSKCGIVPGVMYDLSEEYILKSVDGILDRMNTEYLDCLILHRPDALVEPEEVAGAFDKLEAVGKVKYFGVSNMDSMQIELLKKYVKQPIVTNQLQLSITNSNMISSGMEVNMSTEGAVNRDGNILNYCRFNDITIQTWSPFQYGMFEGSFLGNERFPELNKVIDELAEKYQVSNTAIATAWIMRHPANMQMVAGTTNKERLVQIAKATEIVLSRDEWYRLYLSAGHILP